MRCANCGADIPEGMLICPDCRTEVQIVPDYNPLDDVLTREVRGSVEDATRPIDLDQLKGNYKARAPQNNPERTERTVQRRGERATRVLSQDEVDRLRAQRANAQRRRSRTESERNSTQMRKTESTKRQLMERKRRARKRRIKRLLITLLVLAGICAGIGVLYYQNSYQGCIRKGNADLGAGEYSSALKYFDKAISKNTRNAEAYIGKSKVYLAQDKMDEAESVFLDAVMEQPENVELYKAGIQFYLDTERPEEISGFLEACDETVLAKLTQYVAKAPEFSLEEGTYEEVQEVALTADGTIYYTEDGSEPTTSSTEYTEPVLLSEGTTVIKAICVNKKGIPSLCETRTYSVNIPIAGPPAVTPSTGQFTVDTKITIDVPEGYTAYYTLDGSTPSAASTLYTEPIDMPEGSHIFSAVLLSKNGKLTPVTTRSYTLEYDY